MHDDPTLLRYDLTKGSSRIGDLRFYAHQSRTGITTSESTYLLEFDAQLEFVGRGEEPGTQRARVTVSSVTVRRNAPDGPDAIDPSSIEALERTPLSFDLSDRGAIRDRTIVPEGLSEEAEDLFDNARSAIQLGFVELPETAVHERDRWEPGSDDPLVELRGELVRIARDRSSPPSAEVKIHGKLRQNVSESITIESQVKTKVSFAIADGWPTHVVHKLVGSSPGVGPFSVELEVRWTADPPTPPE